MAILPYLLYIVVSLVRLMLGFFELALIVYAITTWFPVDEESTFIRLLDSICEPILYPARLLVDKSDFLSSLPIDLSFFITYIGLSLISAFLPRVII